MSKIQRHLFVIDPLSKLNPKLDSTLKIASALSRLGHEAWCVTPADLSWPSSAVTAVVKARRLVFSSNATPTLGPSSYHELAETLDAFAAVHIRKDPPFDENYLVLTWLLESGLGRTHLFNEPQALRALNEKTAIMLFPEVTEPAFISNNPDGLYHAWEKQFGGLDIIIKPMTLFGGRGVTKLTRSLFLNKNDALLKLRELTEEGNSWRIIQRFIDEVTSGEVRAFCVGGTPIAWCLKKPQNGQYLANTAAGATLHPYQPSASLHRMVSEVASRLYQWGISFVGLDIIAGKISEINVTSPRLLQGVGDTNDYYLPIASWIENKSELKPQTKHWAK